MHRFFVKNLILEGLSRVTSKNEKPFLFFFFFFPFFFRRRPIYVFVSPVSAQMTRTKSVPAFVDQGRVGDFTRSGGGCMLLYSDASTVYFDIMLITF